MIDVKAQPEQKLCAHTLGIVTKVNKEDPSYCTIRFLSVDEQKEANKNIWCKCIQEELK